MSRLVLRMVVVCVALVALVGEPSGGRWGANRVWAQDQLPGLDGELLGGPSAGSRAGGTVEVTARIEAAAAGPPQLVVSARIGAGWHIYSLTQAPGGPIASKIQLDPSPQAQLAGPFTSEPDPERHVEPLFDDLAVETHEGVVTWRAPLSWGPGVDPASVELRGKLTVQACSDNSCLPPEKLAFSARLNGGSAPAGESRGTTSAPAAAASPSTPEPPASVGSYQKRGTHTLIRGELSAASATPGQTVWLALTAEPGPGFHVYGWEPAETAGVSKPTLIAWSNAAGMRPGQPQASSVPELHPSPIPGDPPALYHQGPVTWRVRLEIPADAAPGPRRLVGMIGYQACTDTSCEPPLGARFEADFTVSVATAGSAPGASNPEAAKVPLDFYAAKYTDAARLARGASGATSSTTISAGGVDAAPTGNVPLDQLFTGLAPRDLSAGFTNLWAIFGAALVGGFLLNLMPCVLPVVGLKILAFVQQSGQHRRETFVLNLWYSLGVIAVFMVLATLATVLNLGWGQQFTSLGFNVTLSALVFAMGLSFLGVWELPIPGFAGGSGASELAAREGAAGAFFKGALSTVLATPCSGPFLGPVFAFTLTVSPATTYALFAAIGLGMASPYLLIGAFPRLIRFLPKPGAWMDTFKNVMGFVMLGTVVYLFSFLDQDYLVATFALLIGVWAACWWIGRTPVVASRWAKAGAWLGGGAVVAAVGGVAFTFLVPRVELIAWQPFSAARLAQLTAEGRTVLVDFTADWCLTCKTNEAVALNTAEVHGLVESNGVVPLKADWTEPNDEIKGMLELLGSNSIPVYAVFPADRPKEPLVLRDLVSKWQIVSALREAGPSRSPATMAAAVSR